MQETDRVSDDLARSDRRSEHVDTFERLLAAWAEAIVANDAEAIARFAEPDWVMVGATGITEGRRFLAAVAAGRVTHSWMTFEVHRVRVDGDVATVLARGRNRGSFDGTPFELDEWTTDVFVRRGDGWRCAVTHLTEVAAPSR